MADVNPEAATVMSADPAFTPVTFGARLADMPPSGIKMFAGATVALDGSLLLSERNTPPDGAAVPSVRGKGADWPGATVTLAGTIIPVEGVAETVTLAVAFPKLGVLAVMVADPPVIPVSGTFTLLAPAENVTVVATVATPEFDELTLAVKPEGAGPDRLSVRLPVAPVLIMMLPGEKKLLPPVVITCT